MRKKIGFFCEFVSERRGSEIQFVTSTLARGSTIWHNQGPGKSQCIARFTLDKNF